MILKPGFKTRHLRIGTWRVNIYIYDYPFMQSCLVPAMHRELMGQTGSTMWPIMQNGAVPFVHHSPSDCFIRTSANCKQSSAVIFCISAALLALGKLVGANSNSLLLCLTKKLIDKIQCLLTVSSEHKQNAKRVAHCFLHEFYSTGLVAMNSNNLFHSSWMIQGVISHKTGCYKFK